MWTIHFEQFRPEAVRGDNDRASLLERRVVTGCSLSEQIRDRTVDIPPSASRATEKMKHDLARIRKEGGDDRVESRSTSLFL